MSVRLTEAAISCLIHSFFRCFECPDFPLYFFPSQKWLSEQASRSFIKLFNDHAMCAADNYPVSIDLLKKKNPLQSCNFFVCLNVEFFPTF